MTDQQIAKWIDQLQGELDTLKRTAGSGGSTVTITPTLQSGEKVADYSIDGTEGAIYAPTEKAGIYSSIETLVGTFDDQDVYRTVFVDETPLSGTSKSIDVSSKNIDKVVKVSALLKDVTEGITYYTPMPFFDGVNAGYIDTVIASAISIRYNATIATNRGNKGCVIILEYTKTPATTNSRRKK